MQLYDATDVAQNTALLEAVDFVTGGTTNFQLGATAQVV